MLGYFKQAVAVRARSGKSVTSQIKEIFALRFSHHQLGPSEYYLYQLEDDSKHSWQGKQEFVGWRDSIRMDRALNNDQWRIFANDKVAFYSMMEANGIAYPKVEALFDAAGRQMRGAVALGSDDAACAYLRNPDNYPLFIKPVSGTYGRGAFSAMSYSGSDDAIVMGNGERLSIAAALKMFNQHWARGYVMQRLLTPHLEVADIVGQRVSSLRIIALLTAHGPKIFRAVWKLPTGNNMSDNFMHGETGNLIANVNLDTGIIDSALTGIGANTKTFSHHPDTGAVLERLRVPMWDAVVAYVLQGAPLFPGLRMQHWDIALCPEGPVALEVNVEGSMDLHQIAGKKGVADRDMLAVLVNP